MTWQMRPVEDVEDALLRQVWEHLAKFPPTGECTVGRWTCGKGCSHKLVDVAENHGCPHLTHVSDELLSHLVG